MKAISNIQYQISNTQQGKKNFIKLFLPRWTLDIGHWTLNRGFTLIEILIVIGIIAALAVMAAMSYSSILQRSRDGKRKADIEQVRSAIELFRADKGYYPLEGGGSAIDVANLASLAPYIGNLPIDPGGKVYMYTATDPNPTSTAYYGYCLSAALEALPAPDDLCSSGFYTTDTDYNYGRKNP